MYRDPSRTNVNVRNCIRELAEFGAARKKEIGDENVFDFSLGNPSVAPPECVNRSIIEILSDTAAPHAYTTAAGLPSLREKIAWDVNVHTGLELTKDDVYVTCGAAAALAITLNALVWPGDEILAPAPCFTEYRFFSEAAGAKFIYVPSLPDMQPDTDAIEKALTERTKAIMINSPNNPSGAVFTEESLTKLADVLRRGEERFGHPIYLISDEPYRELVYDGVRAHSAMKFHDNAVMCYSWSKSLSVPGERIGYIALSSRMKEKSAVYNQILAMGRVMGYVNPPSLFQRVMERCIEYHIDANVYRVKRNLLCKVLDDAGFEYVKPDGAFYLFIKALEPDAKAFSEQAKKHELLLVPSDDFGVTGYVRAAYCVSEEMIERSAPAFKALYDDYR